MENALAGGTSPGTTVLAVRRASEPCNAGGQCTSSVGRSLTRVAQEFATTSTPSQEKATLATPTTPTPTAPGVTRMAGSASRTPSMDQTLTKEADAKQGKTRTTAHPSKATASTSPTAILTPLARKNPMLESLDNTGGASVTRDGLATESNVWTAMAQ